MKNETTFAKRLGVTIMIIIALFLITSVIALILTAGNNNTTGNVAHIKIIGPIYGDSSSSLFSDSTTSSAEIVKELEEARDDDTIKAVILEINSPGGSAVASDEIGQAIKDVRAANKTVVAWVREVGASGGYWVASSSDYIVANRMSITGSIGVIGSYMEFNRFLERYNVSYNRLIAGDKKDIGDPFVDMTPEDKAFVQHKLNRIHQFFIAEIAQNRNMTEKDVARLATGEYYLGIEAKDLGLIDELGGKEQAVKYIEDKKSIKAELVEYGPDKSLFDEMLGIFSQKKSLDVKELAYSDLEMNTAVPMLK